MLKYTIIFLTFRLFNYNNDLRDKIDNLSIEIKSKMEHYIYDMGFFSDHVPNRTARCGAVQRHRTATAAVRGFAQQRQQQGSQRRESSQEMSAVSACAVLSGRPAPRRPLSAVSTSIRACHAPAEAGRDQEDPHWSASDRWVSVINDKNLHVIINALIIKQDFCR